MALTLADILSSLFPQGHDVVGTGGLLGGTAPLPGGGRVHVIGITGRTQPGADEALALSAHVLAALDDDQGGPILVLIDSGSQRMSKRDELLGLNETLAHLAKALRLASLSGRRTIGVLHGGSAAGAFIATALACDRLVALPGAHPEVMDLPSMARVTKLPVEVLEAKARTTAVFAPGLDNLVSTGAIDMVWDPAQPLSDQLAKLLREPATTDRRAELGRQRGGRPKAADIAAEVQRLAQAHG